MKRLIQAAVIFFLAMALAACGTQGDPVQPAATDTLTIGRPEQPKARANNKILILAPQGVEPDKDAMGFNALVQRATQGFSTRLQDSLKSRGQVPVNILDQGLKYDLGQKLAVHAYRYDTDAAIILTLDSVKSGPDYTIYMKVQYVDLVFQEVNGRKAVTPTAPITRSYYMSGPRRDPKQSAPPTLTELAEDFVQALKTAGRF